MLPLIPIVVIGLAGLGVWKVRSKKGVMTKERQAIFETAMRVLQDPDKLRQLADAYQKEGLKAQADLLRKRADLRELPPDVKEGRRDAFRKGMASTNIAEIEKLAAMFEKETATGAAKALRDHAKALKAAADALKHDVPAHPNVPTPPHLEPGLPPKAAGEIGDDTDDTVATIDILSQQGN
jgi:ATP-dependent DNA ligase